MSSMSLNKRESTEPPKTPPYSQAAEQSVLGGLMLDNESWDQITSIVQANDFYCPEHRLIFQAFEQLTRADKPLDALTLKEWLITNQKINEAGGEVYLFELANNTPTVANIVAYADIVRERSVLRQLLHIAQDIAEVAFNPGARSIAELIDFAEQKVFTVGEQSLRHNAPQHIRVLAKKTVERIDELSHTPGGTTGLATGFLDLDRMTSGLQPSDLIVIAGRPSMGKTILAMNIAEQVAIKEKAPALVFSMEMPGDAIAMRMIAALGRIDQHRLRTGNVDGSDWPRISHAVDMLSEAPLFIDDTPNLSPSELRARTRRVLKEQGRLSLVVVDYLQLMHMPGYRPDQRTAEISEISRSLKTLAKEIRVPVVALSQLNRSLEQRSDRRPVMSDLRESGAIEQDADLIGFIYRDEVYNEDTQDKGIAEFIIAKQRNGPIGKIRLKFFGHFARFDSLEETVYTKAEL